MTHTIHLHGQFIGTPQRSVDPVQMTMAAEGVPETSHYILRDLGHACQELMLHADQPVTTVPISTGENQLNTPRGDGKVTRNSQEPYPIVTPGPSDAPAAIPQVSQLNGTSSTQLAAPFNQQ